MIDLLYLYKTLLKMENKEDGLGFKEEVVEIECSSQMDEEENESDEGVVD